MRELPVSGSAPVLSGLPLEHDPLLVAPAVLYPRRLPRLRRRLYLRSLRTDLPSLRKATVSRQLRYTKRKQKPRAII